VSRYPKPGSTMSAWWEEWVGAGVDRELRTHMGACFVLATSRHKASASPGEALEVLAAEWGPEEVVGLTTFYFRSVTQSDYDGDTGEISDGADVGGWDAGATGAAWVQVACPVFSSGRTAGVKR